VSWPLENCVSDSPHKITVFIGSGQLFFCFFRGSFIKLTNIAHTVFRNEVMGGNYLGSQESGTTQYLKISDFDLEFAKSDEGSFSRRPIFRYRSEMTSSVLFPIRLSSDPKTEIPESHCSRAFLVSAVSIVAFFLSLI